MVVKDYAPSDYCFHGAPDEAQVTYRLEIFEVMKSKCTVHTAAKPWDLQQGDLSCFITFKPAICSKTTTPLS